MVDEDELERRVLALGGELRRAGGVHDHAVLRGQRAAGLQLRDALQLDQAHPARADRRAEPGLVAEHGDLDPGRLRGLDEAGALRHLNLPLVDRDGHRVRDDLAHGTSTAGTRACIATGARTWWSGELSPNGQLPRSMCAMNSSRNFAT